MKRNVSVIFTLLVSLITFAGCGNRQSKHPSYADKAIVYELNMRQFTDEGTLSMATTRLSHLKMLGVNVIVLTPVQPIGIVNRIGKLGNSYSIRDYVDVNPDIGSIEDFRSFTDEAHRLGFRVLLDWVGGYTSRDAVWLDNTGWYVMGEDNLPAVPEGRMDCAVLNYDNMYMREEMMLAMHFWLREGHIDGFRCHDAALVPADFWAHAIAQLKNERKELLMITDTDYGDIHSRSFNISTSGKLYAIMRGIAGGRENVSSLREYISEMDGSYVLRMNYTSNHEENQWNGTEFDRLGDAVKCFAALKYLLPDVPMISNGQEVGANRSLDNLVHDPINWRSSDKKDFLKLYRMLNRLKEGNSALNAGFGKVVFIPNSREDNVLSFIRENSGDKCIAVLNLSAQPIGVRVEYGGNSGEYIDVGESKLVRIEDSEILNLAPWQVYILSNC